MTLIPLTTLLKTWKKTNMDIDKQEILIKTENGLQIYKRYISTPFILNKAFKSPLREDKNPSFSIFQDKTTGKYLFKDFARDEQTGDAIRFTMLKYQLHFIEALQKIASDFGIYQSANNQKQPEKIVKKMDYKEKEFTSSELDYFKQYGIFVDIIEKYHLKSLDFVKINQNSFKSSHEKPMFLYRFEWGGKIYNPFNKNYRFMYLGNIPKPYIFGKEQLDDTADILIITGGEKDVMTFASLGYNAICFNSETANIEEKHINQFRKRFKYIAVCFDTDITGLSASKELSDKNALIRIKLPLSGKKRDKDISDFIKNGHTKEELITIINKSIDRRFEDTLRILNKHTFNEKRVIEKPIPVLRIEENNILSLGNFSVLAGKVKTGKSAVLYSIISGAISKEPNFMDTLGIRIEPNLSEKAVIHFDTEQSDYDWHTRIMFTLKRAGLRERPVFFNSYHLLEFTLNDRLQHIKDMIDYNYRKFKGIHLIVVDGVADLVKSVNDEEKSNEVVDLFHQLAGAYSCPIVLAVHLNPDGSKTRGHLGSQLDRKAESVINIEKEGDISSINPKYCRNANAVDIPIMQFKWDYNLNQHIAIGAKSPEQKKEELVEEYKDVLDEIFTNGIDNIDKNTFKELLSEKFNLKRSAIYKIINFMLQMDLISEKDFGNKSKIISRIY